MVKIKFDTMEISCNHETAEYLACLCESALQTISRAGSDSQYIKCDRFVDAIYNAIDDNFIKIGYDEYRDLLHAMRVYTNFQIFNGVLEEEARAIIDLLHKGSYRKNSTQVVFSSDDFAQIMNLVKFAYESERFEYHYKTFSRIIADFYEKYKAAL